MRSDPSLPGRAFVDTSAFYAVADADDAAHETARRIRRSLVGHQSRLFTSNFIIDESYTLIRYHLGYRQAISFLDQLSETALTIVRITHDDEMRAEQILRRYRDKAFSYTDATSFVVMERLSIPTAFSFDNDFTQYGFVTLGASLF